MLICHLGCSRDEVDAEGDVVGISSEGAGSQVESVVLLKIQHLGRSTIIVIIFIILLFFFVAIISIKIYLANIIHLFVEVLKESGLLPILVYSPESSF